MRRAKRRKKIRRKRKLTDAFVYSSESSDYKYAKRDEERLNSKVHCNKAFLSKRNPKTRNISVAFKTSICLPYGPLTSKNNIFRNTARVIPFNYVPDSESTQAVHSETFGSIDPEIWEIIR